MTGCSYRDYTYSHQAARAPFAAFMYDAGWAVVVVLELWDACVLECGSHLGVWGEQGTG